MNISELLREAIDAGALPRVHGNGFIQLDVDPRRRLHFWGHCEIPRACPMTPVHDHVFDFTSASLKGWILNLNYREEVHHAGLYDVNMAAPVKLGENGWGLLPTGERVNLTLAEINHVGPGDGYFMPAFVLHQTIFDGPAVTLITKQGDTLAQNPNGPKPRILSIHRPDAIDSRFDRNRFDVNKLWDIIHQICEG